MTKKKEKRKRMGMESIPISSRPNPTAARVEPDLTAGGGYLSLPYVVKDLKVKITFPGNVKHVFDQTGVRYRVVALMDAKSPLVHC